MAITWLRYPTDVKNAVRTILVQVQLPAGSAVANLTILAAQSSPGVGIYTENGAIVSKTISAPLNQHEICLTLASIDDHTEFVLGSVDPESQQAVVVALQESVTLEIAQPIEIKVAPIAASTVVTSEKTLFSDDFPNVPFGATLRRDLWTTEGFDIGGLDSAPDWSLSTSVLRINNTAASATRTTRIRSDVVEGRCHISFRGTRESVRRNLSEYIFGAYFFSAEETGFASLNTGIYGFVLLSINIDALGVSQNDPATTIHLSTAGDGPDQAADVPLLLPGGGLTTGTHDYEIDFDGHQVVITIDGTIVATVTTKIPSVISKRFVVFMRSHMSGVPAGNSYLEFDRVDVSSDERLVTIGAAGAAPAVIGIVAQGAPGPVASAWPVELAAPIMSKPSPDPSAIEGAITAGLLDPDRALRTRARILTDEDSFVDDFGNGAAALPRALAANCTFTNGSTAVVGAVGAAFTTAVRAGDYVQLNADDAPAAPKWAQVASITDDTNLTLVSAYTGAGGAAGASSVQNYTELVIAGGAIGVAASALTLSVGAAAGDVSSVTRSIGAGGRKRALPVRVGFYASISARRANQETAIGVRDPVSGGPAARFLFSGTDDSIVTCSSMWASVAGDYWEENVSIPNAGVTYAEEEHWFEIILYADRVVWLIDYQKVAEHAYHLPDPYLALALFAEIQNTAGAGATALVIDWCGYNGFDDVRVEATQPDVAKLWTSARDMGLLESRATPNPTSILGATLTSMRLDPDAALKSRARVLTDEGSFADDFLNGEAVQLARGLTGSVRFTLGSRVVVGQAGTSLFTTEIREGDYIELDVDDDPTSPEWAQVAQIIDDTHLLLTWAYTGAGGAAGAASVQDYISGYVGAGTDVTVASSVCSIDPGMAQNGSAYLLRHLGVAGRKGWPPTRFVWYGQLNGRAATHLAQVGLTAVNASGSLTTGGAHWLFDGAVPEVVKCVTNSSALTAGASTSQTSTITLLDGGSTDDDHRYEIICYHDRVQFLIDGVQVALHSIHLVDPYQGLAVYERTWLTAGVQVLSSLAINWNGYENLDTVIVEAAQADPTKLNATTVDHTPSAPTHGTTTAITTDNSTALATVDIGKRYRVTIIGGDGVVICNGTPAARATDEPWWAMQRFEFVAVAIDVTGQKLVAGTANLSVNVMPLDT